MSVQRRGAEDDADQSAESAAADAAEKFKEVPRFGLSARACLETERLLEQLVAQRARARRAKAPHFRPSARPLPSVRPRAAETQAAGKTGASEEQLREMNVDELRDMDREKGLGGVSERREEKLIEAISPKRGS